MAKPKFMTVRKRARCVQQLLSEFPPIQPKHEGLINYENLKLAMGLMDLDMNTMYTVCASYEIAEKIHAGQKRPSGEDYITHPIHVTFNLLKYGYLDKECLATGMLHDTIEDGGKNGFSVEEIEDFIGSRLGILIGWRPAHRVIRMVEKLSNNFYGYGKGIDFEVLPVKLCDVLHNLSTLEQVAEIDLLKAIKLRKKYRALLMSKKDLAERDYRTRKIWNSAWTYTIEI